MQAHIEPLPLTNWAVLRWLSLHLLLLLQPGTCQPGDTFRTVGTAQDLQQAIFEGVSHIVIVQHLSMGSAQPWALKYEDKPVSATQAVLSVKQGTKTITVRI